MDEDCEKLKILVIGNKGTGKTSISTRYCQDQYDELVESTLGVSYY